MALVVVALMGISLASLAASVTTMRTRAGEVAASLGSLKDAARDGDLEAFSDIAEDISDDAHAIRFAAHSPLLYLGRLVPGYGADVKSVQVLSSVFVDLTDNVLVPASTNPAILNYKAIFSDGAVDVSAIESLSGVIDDAAPVLRRCADRMEGLQAPHVGELGSLLDRAKDAISSGSEMATLAQELLPHVPSLFGAEGGPKNYLVVALTNAEPRSAGGFPGSWTLVTCTDGKIEMGKTVTLQHKSDDFLAFTDEEKAAYAGVTGNMGSIPFLPDFSRVGELMAAGYEHHRSVHIDGVIAIDPVFLQKVLALTGSITASDGTVVDGTNAAWELMSNVYWRYGNSNSEQDIFFAEVASLAFDKLMHGLGDVGIRNLYGLISDSAAVHRFQVWMEDEDVQAILSKLGFTGEIPADPAAPVLGIYVSDNTWAKIGWYLRIDTQVLDPVENEDGSLSYDVVTTFTNSAWADELKYAPRYVWGYNAPDKRTDSDMVLFPTLIAPAGGSIDDLGITGTGSLGPLSLYGFDIYRGRVQLDVGESVVLTYTVTTSPEAEEPLTVRETPLAQERLLSIEYAWDGSA